MFEEETLRKGVEQYVILLMFRYYCLTSQLSCSKTLVLKLLLLYVPHHNIVFVSCVGMVWVTGRVF